MGSIVSFKSNGATSDGYLALPPAGNGRGIIVIQEWWGLVPHIKDMADRFAQAGFVALAPDLYHGRQTQEPGEAGKLMMALEVERAEKDLRGATEFLLNHPAVSSKKVGIVGYCMGGALSLFGACSNPDAIGACVVYYGGHPNITPDLTRLQAPVLGFYGGKDGFATPAGARELQKQIRALGKEMEIHIYPDCDHAFCNNDRPEVYNQSAANDTWRRTVEFFNATL